MNIVGGFLCGLRGRALTTPGRPRQAVQHRAMSEGARGIANNLSQADDALDPERPGCQLVAVRRPSMRVLRGFSTTCEMQNSEASRRRSLTLEVRVWRFLQVYGSLITGLHNHRHIEKQTLLGQGIVSGFDMFAYNGASLQSGYPAISPVEGGASSQVVVQVWVADRYRPPSEISYDV